MSFICYGTSRIECGTTYRDLSTNCPGTGCPDYGNFDIIIGCNIDYQRETSTPNASFPTIHKRCLYTIALLPVIANGYSKVIVRVYTLYIHVCYITMHNINYALYNNKHIYGVTMTYVLVRMHFSVYTRSYPIGDRE